jgi:hypothetical protein
VFFENEKQKKTKFFFIGFKRNNIPASLRVLFDCMFLQRERKMEKWKKRARQLNLMCELHKATAATIATATACSCIHTYRCINAIKICVLGFVFSFPFFYFFFFFFKGIEFKKKKGKMVGQLMLPATIHNFRFESNVKRRGKSKNEEIESKHKKKTKKLKKFDTMNVQQVSFLF